MARPDEAAPALLYKEDDGDIILDGDEFTPSPLDDIAALDAAPNDRVTADATVPINAVAVGRVVVGTCTDNGTADKYVRIANNAGVLANGIVNDLISTGADAEGFAAGIVAWIINEVTLSVIGADSAVDNEDGTFSITLAPGADGNDLVFSTDDPALTFEDVTDGADAEPFQASVGQINGCLRYVAIATESNPDPPIMDVQINELGGDVVWTYQSDGRYIGTLAGAFPTGRVGANSGVTTNGTSQITGLFSIGNPSNDTVKIFTSILDGTLTDGLLVNTKIEIEVYPA